MNLPSPRERLRVLEAMLFASPGPVKPGTLAEACGWERELVCRDLERLQMELDGRGIELQRVAGAYRLVTCPETAPYVERLLKVQNRRQLSRALMETLAVIAYRQPVTRGEIEAYRGVRCERSLRQLVELGLVQQVGAAPAPGRPALYGTTAEFLERFGLDRLEDLPPVADSGQSLARPPTPAEPPRPAPASRGEDLDPSPGLKRLLERIRVRREDPMGSQRT